MRGFLAQEVPTNDEANTVLYRRSIRTIDDDIIDETYPIARRDLRTTTTAKAPFRCPYVRFPRWCFWLGLLLSLALLATILGVGIGLGSRNKSIYETCSSQSVCMNNAVCTGGYCLCNTGYFYDSTLGLCISQVGIGHFCSTDNQCFTNALCTNGVCRCITNYYPSPTTGLCAVQLTYGQSCSYDVQCAFTFECLLGVCACNSTHYYSTLTLECEKLGEPNQDTCYANYNCISTAVCIGGVCRCPTNWYYNVFTDTCDRDIPIGGICTYNYQCITNALCTLVGTMMRCQCINGTTYSIASAACIIPIAYNQACVVTSDCASNFICTYMNGAYYCLCGTNTRYYNALNATCLDKVLFGKSCSSSGPYCDDIRLLQCNASGICTCPSGYYNSAASTRCEAQIYPGNTCIVAEVSCITNANCVTVSGSLVCQCSNGSYYYDITSGQCVALKGNGIACSEQEQCKTGLKCLANICQCPSSQYYNISSMTCNAAGTINSTCSISSGLYCNTAVGLSCDTSLARCVCATNYYWSTTMCAQKSNLYQSCSLNAQCPTGGTCSTTCQCSSSTYYNSTTNTCVAYQTYGQTCVANVFVASECSPTTSLVCSPIASGTCQCASGYYYSTSMICTADATVGQTCSTTILCDDSKGLFCGSSSICQCSTGYYAIGTSSCAVALGAGQTCVGGSCANPFGCVLGKCACSTATTYYDLTTVQCDAKKGTGVPCSYGFECLSNTCTSNSCT